MSLRWRNSFRCDVREIDMQHKRLFEIGSKLNILEPICTKISINDEILDVIKELKEYSIYHFEYEENLMLNSGYEEYEDHCMEHNSFIDRVRELEQDSLRLCNPEILRGIIVFINHWITNHILKTDMKYVVFFRDRGIT